MISCKKLVVLVLTAVLSMTIGAGLAFAETTPTLAKIKKRGKLNCATHNGTYQGFTEIDDKGHWSGFDVELCRAVASAIFGDPNAVHFVPVSWAQRWPTLQSGDADLVINASGATFRRNNVLGLQFSLPYFLGTTRIMFHKKLGVTKLSQANGATVCVPAGTTIERQVASYAEQKSITLHVKSISDTSQLHQAYYSGRCDAFAQWGPIVGIVRSQAPHPDNNVILPDKMAVEAEAIYVRQGDQQWLNLINWVLSTLWYAEQEGITSKNVDSIKANSPDPQTSRVLGVTPGIGKPFGLPDHWAYDVIKNVGNYEQIFARSLGKDSGYNVPRGLNKLWNKGGVFYPLTFD